MQAQRSGRACMQWPAIWLECGHEGRVVLLKVPPLPRPAPHPRHPSPHTPAACRRYDSAVIPGLHVVEGGQTSTGVWGAGPRSPCSHFKQSGGNRGPGLHQPSPRCCTACPPRLLAAR